MTIWNIDVWQKQKHFSLAVSCHYMSFSDKVFYWLDSTMFLSQIIAIMIYTAKLEINNFPCTTENILKSELTETCMKLHPCVM